MNKKLALAVSFALGLSACGSDDNTTTPPPVEPPPTINPAWQYIDTGYMELETKLEGEITVAIGIPNWRAEWWRFGWGEFEGNKGTDVNGDGVVNVRDADMAGIKNDAGLVFKAKADDIHKVLRSNPDGLGAGTARPDIFTEGNYSAFDIMRYVVATRDDLRFESVIKPEDSKYDTYEYTVSFDKNQDGIFNEDDGEYYNSPDWFYAMTQHGGHALDIPSRLGERFYLRSDQFWVQTGAQVRLQPFNSAMTGRRQLSWLKEQQFLAANDGKYIVPKITIVDKDRVPHTIVENLEVKAHNLRNDIFQEGVITFMDVFLSAAEQGYDFKLSWWPILSSGAIVNNFQLSANPLGDYGSFEGYDSRYSWSEFDDFQWPGYNGSGLNGPDCSQFGLDGKPDGEGQLDLDTCRRDFANFNEQGGYKGNIAVSARIARYPQGEVTLNYVDMSAMMTGKSELNSDIPSEWDFSQGKDNTEVYLLETLKAADENNPSGNAPIVDSNHFGWQIADCALCHNETKDPKGHGGASWPVNKAAGFDVVQPYYCSTCHGSNGAPEMHSNKASCYWCHSQDKMPSNHGEASSKMNIGLNESIPNRISRRGLYNQTNTNFDQYDGIVEGKNNFYWRAVTFPDPHSCATCHQAK
ncbi:hypothetical protein EKG38_10865 [Shewanella canadensis]|uniref:Uncharacterized protein n=1 Tax=Shewanella canadensis TaxID=271096 RepID=A0A3S0ISF2_9GAMM|nr:hypothetical protein [Shewanella canadensis]RTR38673.1 hypothetical protein EKG38_10865 [Shewanella canadensis]